MAMGPKKKAKLITLLSAIVSLLSFGYKLTLGIMTMSLVLMIASLSTFLVFVCKAAFVKFLTATRERKKKAYLVMAISVLLYAAIFILFVVLKVNNIDISNQKTYEGLWGALFIGFIVLMFGLSLFNLHGALEKTDLMVIGLKEMIFVSALADLVIIEEFVSRIILQYQDIEFMPTINSYFCMGVGAFMALIGVLMIVRFAKYKA
ncbi:MAG: hypothetical protein J5736_04755 [Bacilli bacterium]|nr:hypothetical protein [Bacilli bacterium]